MWNPLLTLTFLTSTKLFNFENSLDSISLKDNPVSLETFKKAKLTILLALTLFPSFIKKLTILL